MSGVMARYKYKWEETGQTINGHRIERKIRYRRNPSADYGGNHLIREEAEDEFRCMDCDRKTEKRFKFSEEFPECEG
jgi:hypothetical protein